MIRLSHSSLETLRGCERMFQLNKLLVNERQKEHYPATVSGTAFGAAIANYLAYQDIDRAIFALFLAYYPLEEDNIRTQETTISIFLLAVPTLDQLLMEWEVVWFNNKPALELPIRFIINEEFYFVGYIDVVLRNKITNKYAVADCKLTAWDILDIDPMFKNSGQCIGYSIALDSIVGKEFNYYDVIYLVGRFTRTQFKDYKFDVKIYPKTLHDRLNWLISLGIDIQRISLMREIGVFPMRGNHCLQYRKPCIHFGTCHLHTLDSPVSPVVDTNEYAFTFQLDDAIQSHLQRVTSK